MPKTTVAAIDLGATSGRVIVGTYSEDGLDLTEIHRFPNAFHELNGNFYWGVGTLMREIRSGIKQAKALFPGLKTVGVDTWAVDYAMLNRDNRLVFPTHAYRDPRTEPIRDAIIQRGDARKLFDLTGLPVINYNTGLQLKESLDSVPALHDSCDRVLLLSDFINFLLSGVAVNEFSQASSTQLLDVSGTTYSKEALAYFGVPERWFEGPVTAGRILGKLVGVEDVDGVDVALVPGHDTSCAFEAIPREGNSLIVSSGTWNLVGTICDEPFLGDDAFKLGISNERCGDGGYRPCKILLGLWLIERTIPVFDKRPHTDAEWSALIRAAEEAEEPTTLIDISDRDLFNPVDMRKVIDAQLRRNGGIPPPNLPGYIRLICASLAHGIADTAAGLAAMTGQPFDNIVIVGGGSKNRLLCQSLANAAGIDVISFALEATSVGNLAYQLLALGAIPDLPAFHNVLRPHLSQHRYRPR